MVKLDQNLQQGLQPRCFSQVLYSILFGKPIVCYSPYSSLQQPGHHVDPFMDNQEFVGPPLSKDSLNLSGESCFTNKADSYQTADAATNMLSDKDPLLPSSSTPFRLELQADGTEQCEISTTEGTPSFHCILRNVFNYSIHLKKLPI